MTDSAVEHLERARWLRQICSDDESFLRVLQKVRRDARKLSNPISVDLTSRCNLFCEGCYYYEGTAQAMVDEEDASKWRNFFREQGLRNTQYIYVGGAEAALHPERIRAAADFIPNGIIAANGTIKISKDIPYRIAVSVWGGAASTEKLRGGGTFWKAIRNYRADERAVFVYTINPHNLHEIRDVAKIMQAEGCKLTFNMYSPTESYLSKIDSESANDKAFFRFSTQKDNLMFSPESLKACRGIVGEVIEDFPATVVYPEAYNREITQDGPYFDIDPETGYATNCAGLHNGTHKTYLSTMSESKNKCCMPNLDCSQCRVLATTLSSRLVPKVRDVQSLSSVRDWLNICQYWSWFYLNEPYNSLA